MRTVAQKQDQPQQKSSTNFTRSNRSARHEARRLLYLQHTIGNQAVLRTIQPKLTVNTPGDAYEQEADLIAEQVMRTPKPEVQHPCACGAGCPSCETKQPSHKDERFQTTRLTSSDGEITALPAMHEVLASPGQPLDPLTRAFFEQRFGQAFSHVRVHTDVKAAESARAVNALAYTAGRDVVFGAGQYEPGTTKGYRLLAHELAHVDQQRGATPGECPSVIQRQPDPSRGTTTTPGYVEAAHGPSFRLHIVAHASPRWRGALNASDAARRNLELSQRRAEAVRWEIEKLLALHLGTGASVDVDVTVVDQDDTVGVKTEARGSRDTLSEARGNRSDDAQERRRVDVIVDSNQRVSGVAEASRPLLTRPTASRFWHVSVDMSAGGAFVAAGGMLALTLINDSSGQSMTGHVFAGGIGPKASLGTSISIWSDPTGFVTDEPKDFKDFDGKMVQYASGGISLFIGYEWSYLSFLGFGSGARQIDVGGFNAGTVGVGGSTIYGPLLLQGTLPPTELPIKDSDKVSVPYERTESGKDVHRVLFATESASLSDLEVDVLDSFIRSIVASKR